MEVLSLDLIRQKIEALAIRLFEAEAMELIDLKVTGQKNDVQIQITADKASGGISIGECAILNKSLVAAIENDGFLPPESFSLELSSPGLDRPLITRRDFLRYKAYELHFWLNKPVDGKKELQGKLIDVSDTELIIEGHKKSKLVIPFSLIIKGMLVL